MSYTTRRSGGVPANQQANSVGGIGQRRPVVTNNFVPGGTITPAQAQAKATPPTPQQPPQQRQPAAQNNTTIHFRNQQQQQPPQAQVKPDAPQTKPQQSVQQTSQGQQLQQQQQAPVPTQTQAPQRPPNPQTLERVNLPQPAEQKVPQTQQQQPVEPVEQQQLQDITEVAQSSEQQPSENANGEAMETSGIEQPPRRRPWFRRNLPRREMIRRRNFKLSKILKPKNAVAILNEIIKNLTYEVENISSRTDGRTFKASVLYDDIVHEGFGFTEDQAKNGAAEVVLKHYIKANKMAEPKKSEDTTEKMEVVLDDENAHVPLPWQHVASFAIYKLFSQWEEDPSLVGISASYLNVKPETKSSKKMPPNPETINPLMLLNQMMPQARFEEIGRSGNPPQVIFSFRCTVDDQSFVGSGTSKKIAKRAAAFEACYKVLGVTYPPDVFVPSDISSN